MKILKIILIVILALIAIPLIVALFVPKEIDAESEIVINQPQEQVFEYVRYLKNRDEYAVWNMEDPDMKTEYKGEDGTVGFTAYWESEVMGDGQQKITHIDEGKQVNTEIRLDGWDDPMIDAMILETTENENQTRVRWLTTGKMPYPFNLMRLFFNMEDQMDEGLENLKNIVETQAESHREAP